MSGYDGLERMERIARKFCEMKGLDPDLKVYFVPDGQTEISEGTQQEVVGMQYEDITTWFQAMVEIDGL
jgi:hypothetical protein